MWWTSGGKYLYYTSMYGVIFDCDGVLVDSEKWSCSAWIPVLEALGIEVELAEIEAFIGQSDQALVEYFQRRENIEFPPGLIARREREYFTLARGRLRSFPGLREVLEELAHRRVPVGVASSGGPEKIHFSLRQVGLESFFSTLCSATQIERGKPAPDLFLFTAEQMDLRPEHCTVVEDSLPGIRAARRARMRALGFTSSHAAARLRRAGAHHTFAHYGELLSLLDLP